MNEWLSFVLVLAVTALPAAITPRALANQGDGGECNCSKTDLIRDIDYYLAVVESAHADPYRLIYRPSLNEYAGKLKDRVREKGDERLTLLDCYFYLQELAARIQDLHTSVRLPYHCMAEDELFLPFRLKIIDKKVYVVENWGVESVPEFSAILEIDGVPVADLRSETRKLLGSDPNTGLVVSIPVAVYALPGDAPDRGVVPDITVEYTIDDLRQGRDKELEAVRKIVLEEQ